MSLVVGLDIGTSSVKGAVLTGSTGKFRLVDFFMEDIPDLGAETREASDEFVPPPSLEEVIRKTLAERGVKLADFVASVDSKDCVIRQFRVPFTRDEQIRKVVTFTAEEYFPAFSMDEVVLEYLKVGEVDGKSDIAVIALRNTVIAERLQFLKTAEVDPVALDLDAAALFNAFSVTPQFDPEKTTLLIDMGGTSTKIVLVENGQIRKIRSFRVARVVASPDRMIAQPAAVGGEGAPLEGSIENRFDEIEGVLHRVEPLLPGGGDGDAEADVPVAVLSDEEFEQFWQESMGNPDEAETASAPEPGGSPGGGGAASEAASAAAGGEMSQEAYLTRLVGEIQRTFAATRTSIERVCVTGGGSGADGTCLYLRDELGVEAVRIDFGESLPNDLDSDTLAAVNQHGVVAVGLALKEFGKDQTDIDFRKGPYRYEHRFNRLKFPLLLLSGLVFLFFLQTAYWSYNEYQRLKILEYHLQADMDAAYNKFFEEKPVAGLAPLNAAMRKRKQWESGGMGNVGKVVDAVEAIRNVSEVLKGLDFQFKVSSMKFEFAIKARSVSGRRVPVLRPVADSKIDLNTETQGADVLIIKKFQEPVSKFFTAVANVQPTKGGYRISVTLEFKPQVLNALN